jgi:uncharacterized protein (DUF885 family)
MSDIQFWDGWLKDSSKAPNEAIAAAIEGAEQMLAALQNLRPDALQEVSAEINQEAGRALRACLEDFRLYDSNEPGVVLLSIDDDVVKRLALIDMAKEISEWRQRDMRREFDSNAAKEAWALKFDEAAALIRAGKESA